MGKVKVSFDDRMNAVQQSISDHPSYTLEQHKSNICKTHNKTINEKVIAVHEPGYTEQNIIKSNHTRDRRKKEDKHYPSQLAEQNRKSKEKQRENNTDSYIKSKDDKVALRVAFNIIRNDPGTIVCPLSLKRCARTNHKSSYNHLFCPLALKFNMFDGKCFWNPFYGI